MKSVVRGAVAVFAALALFVGAVFATPSGEQITPAERMALRIDAILDSVEAPTFAPESLDPYWVYEVGPFFEYEGLTKDEFVYRTVVWQPLLDSAGHNHLLGFTYCNPEVYLNIRVVNPVSAWYGWERNPLATLVHEMVHTLGGDFCSFDSETAESTTQTATLEVLAALANGGNAVALYSLLLELKDTALDVVLADALKNDDLNGYRAFLKRIDPSAQRAARFEKSMRFWADDMGGLKEILSKYSVLVFNNVQSGTLKVDVPFLYRGDGVKDTVKLDDLVYVLAHAEDLAGDSLEPVAA